MYDLNVIHKKCDLKAIIINENEDGISHEVYIMVNKKTKRIEIYHGLYGSGWVGIYEFPKDRLDQTQEHKEDE